MLRARSVYFLILPQCVVSKDYLAAYLCHTFFRNSGIMSLCDEEYCEVIATRIVVVVVNVRL